MKCIGKKWKCVLDALLLILLALMFRKNALGMTFHEIGGLALIAFFVIHHLFNQGWIVAVTKRLFRKETPAKAKAQYAVGVLLLSCFVLIGVSGACISKVVFRLNAAGGGWKTVHYFCSALALLLSGVHIGMHLEYLFGALMRKPQMKNAVVRVATAVLCAALLGYGVYNIASTSLIRWISMPFSQGGDPRRADGGTDDGAFPAVQDGEFPAMPDGAFPAMPDGMPSEGQGRHDGFGKGGNGWGGSQNGEGPNGGMQDGMARNMRGRGQGGSVSSALSTFAQYTSIAAVFAAAAYAVERLLTRKRVRGATDAKRQDSAETRDDAAPPADTETPDASVSGDEGQPNE